MLPLPSNIVDTEIEKELEIEKDSLWKKVRIWFCSELSKRKTRHKNGLIFMSPPNKITFITSYPQIYILTELLK